MRDGDMDEIVSVEDEAQDELEDFSWDELHDEVEGL